MTLDSTATFSDLTFGVRGNINDNNGKRKYQYNKPSSADSVVLLPGFGDTFIGERDIIPETYTADNKNSFIRINGSNPSYDSLCYIPTFPTGLHGGTYKMSFKINPYKAPLPFNIDIRTVPLLIFQP
ncbi:hypothetical protein BGZ90_009970 [Linnemannia elongata]|nr:hypothetical protein BGZ90_009970 [Linnemannia elongata]